MTIFKKISNKVRVLTQNRRDKNVRYLKDVAPEHYKKNIIFLLPALRYPCGGNIVTHSHSDAINQIQYKDFQSQILYPAEPGFAPDLFEHQSSIRRNLIMDPHKDFVVIPDVLVLRHASKLKDAGISYAINVQNGYLMDLEIRDHPEHFGLLKTAYEGAAFIISMSEDTSENIKLVFPACSDKVIASSYVIDKAIFRPIAEKKNLITYMPRKLAKHSEMFLFFLGDKLPPHWKIQAIDGVSENEVYRTFSESKIFLSFSEFEGLAMPPVMAALSGNLVIGYTGEGNKEYFHLPCFQEVACGDIKDFVEKALIAIDQLDRNQYQIDMDSVRILTDMFSKQAQIRFLKNLIDVADQYLI